MFGEGVNLAKSYKNFLEPTTFKRKWISNLDEKCRTNFQCHKAMLYASPKKIKGYEFLLNPSSVVLTQYLLQLKVISYNANLDGNIIEFYVGKNKGFLFRSKSKNIIGVWIFDYKDSMHEFILKGNLFNADIVEAIIWSFRKLENPKKEAEKFYNYAIIYSNEQNKKEIYLAGAISNDPNNISYYMLLFNDSIKYNNIALAKGVLKCIKERKLLSKKELLKLENKINENT